MSLTQWFTRSSPTVVCRFARQATLSFVPTPSVLPTRSMSLPGEAKSPPKFPMPPIEPAVAVDAHISLMDWMPDIFESMSTPAAAYADFFSAGGRGFFGASMGACFR